MKTLVKVFVFLAAIAFSGNLAAQENVQSENSLGHFYNTELFHWSYNMFGGLSLNLYNQSSSTLFGINRSMRDALLVYPDSGQEYRSYRWKNITGNILIWGGLAAVIGGAFIPMLNDYDDRSWNIYAGMSIGALVSIITGSFFYSSGEENIFYAVNNYNRHKIGEYK